MYSVALAAVAGAIITRKRAERAPAGGVRGPVVRNVNPLEAPLSFTAESSVAIAWPLASPDAYQEMRK
jgi:hypothetical protein